MTADAAIMQVAIVPWLRDAETNPFTGHEGLEPKVWHVDLRSCVMEGFEFDAETIKWWARQSDEAKRSVSMGTPEDICNVAYDIIMWLRGCVRAYDLQSLCLWCQGMDFDIAILRSLCRRYDLDLDELVPHTRFRDCRTVILEAALLQAQRIRLHDIACASDILVDGSPVPATAPTPAEILKDPKKAYDLYDPLPNVLPPSTPREAHDALYDALRSSWNTWQALRWLGVA